MFLAFKLSDIITVPFGYLLNILYHTTGNYGVAMILFALVVQLVLLPIKAKSKKSMMKMSRLTPRMQDIQKRYASDPQKQNEMIQQIPGIRLIGHITAESLGCAMITRDGNSEVTLKAQGWNAFTK